MHDYLVHWLTTTLQVTDTLAGLIGWTVLLLAIAVMASAVMLVGRGLVLPLLHRAVARTSTTWDDAFANRSFFQRLLALLPILTLYTAIDLLLPPQTLVTEILRRLAMTLLVVAGIRACDAMLLAINDIYGTFDQASQKPIKGYLTVIKIVLYVLCAIFIVGIVTNKSPWGILSVLGGLTAVLLLIFKDTILGFVANIQLAGNDMIRIGDWIEMPSYGADGDVMDISVHTVKVRNWDKTITTIPTYALVTNAFKNWRGMAESGGRRIKRAITIDLASITFCTPEMLARFRDIALLRDYLDAKEQEITAYNRANNIDDRVLVNGRRQTNIGVFRAYIKAYLEHHPQINREMTFLVRQLPPGPQGLPIEIYVFSSDKVWANYEAIQADIFDHLLAAAPHFDLRLFQYPSGHDLHGLAIPRTP